MILFDAHVHIYDCFDLDNFFASAFKNLSMAGKKVGLHEDCHYFLLMTESREINYFKELEYKRASPSYQIKTVEENLSLAVSHRDYPQMHLNVVAGRQVVTSEKLEVLALITPETFPDGQMNISEALQAVDAAGGVAVCPWGAGKWLGLRGKVLEQQLSRSKEQKMYLGDSGGRPSFWPTPELLKAADHKDGLISGSDPLPIAGQEKRVGSFGTTIRADCDQTAPAASLRQLILSAERELGTFGRGMCPLIFFWNQLRLRV
jgi:hypothetical protein